MNCSKI